MPLVDRPFQWSAPGIRPDVGLNPNSPHMAAGIRMLPPPSLAVARATIPPATAAAEPLLEPPAILAGSCGLRAGPQGSSASGGIVVCPIGMAPAAVRAATQGSLFSAGPRSATPVPSAGAGSPATAWLSLTASGMPSSGRSSPAARAASAAAASSRAAGPRSRTKAFSRSSVAAASAAVTRATLVVVPALRSSTCLRRFCIGPVMPAR